VAQVGALMRTGLESLAKRHDCVGAIRGSGLYWGVDIQAEPGETQASARLTQRIVNGLRAQGVLIGTAGRNATTLKIRPPLVFQREHVDLLTQALNEQCQQACI